MIYLESEAHTKRCTPMQVVRLIERERFDALLATGSIDLDCIGSRCAQWRQVQGLPVVRGYCGLAGAPL